jgi:uncharacterized protein YbdZ (MbtH family)
MARDEAEDTTIYKVVINHEEQYSIWPADRELPLGWQEVGTQGLKDECLASDLSVCCAEPVMMRVAAWWFMKSHIIQSVQSPPSSSNGAR